MRYILCVYIKIVRVIDSDLQGI